MSRFILLFVLLLPSGLFAQFTPDDSLRGSITAERAWWNLLHYDLHVKVDPDSKSIRGKNTIRFEVLEPQQVLQVDLQPPLKVDSIVYGASLVHAKKAGRNAYMVDLGSVPALGSTQEITVFYSGSPKEAVNAPWDGGLVWSHDKSGKHFVATACQGLGASVWWPCKDHMYDEPENGMRISVNTPGDLMDVSNGRPIENRMESDGTRTMVWEVKNPINNYGVNMNVADYRHWSEVYQGEKGELTMDFYVLPDDLEKAKNHFKDAARTMESMEHWFGPYPFYEDGYKLVQVPYLGMEHQSSVTYGNQFRKGYLGMDLSGSGWGLKWDYIIVHESGHEWFANNITYKDAADMWVHEGFTTYSEGLFVEYFYGKEAGDAYQKGLRKSVSNDRPIIGTYNYNHEGSGDMYSKGACLLHTIRQIVNDDEKWRGILRGLNSTFYHQTVTTAQIETYISRESGIDLSKVFDQYLRTIQIPKLVTKKRGREVVYYWENVIEGFDMPVDVEVDEVPMRIFPSAQEQVIKGRGLTVDPNYYIITK